MTPTYRVIEWPGALVWGIVAAIGLASCAAGVLGALPWYGRAAFIAAGASFAGVAFVRTWLRWRKKRDIDRTLSPWGIDVWGVDGREAVDLRALVADELEHWRTWAVQRGRDSTRAVNCMNGGGITFVPKPWPVRGVSQLREGSASGRHITVLWAADEPWSAVEGRIRHELGHVALEAIRGYESEQEDHDEFDALRRP